MKIGLESSTQTVPECNATNAYLTRPNNTHSFAGANRDVMKTMDFFIALFFGLLMPWTVQTLVILPCATVWVDEPSPFVFSGVMNTS